jgi:glycosyltransferase involved in cell wall biosynthesis
MNILVFNWQDRLHPQAGGAEAHLHETFSRLVKRGHTVHLVTCGFDNAPSHELVDGMHVYRIGSRSTYNAHVPFWWIRVGKGLAVDVVVDDINKIPLMTPLFIDKPIVGLIHHLFGKSIYKEASFPAALYVDVMEHFIPRVYAKTPLAVVSESTKTDCVEKGLRSSNMSIIYNGIDKSVFPMQVRQKSGNPVVTYFGRLKAYKSIDHVLRAFQGVLSQVHDAKLWIIGRGDDESRLRALADELHLQQSVVFHGFVDEQKKQELLSASWVVVNPSIKEGWGITNIEANACGTPVVSADSPGLRDSVKIDVSGKLYPYGDIRILQETLIDILTDNAKRTALSHSAVSYAAGFSWDESASAMEELLSTCIASHE